MKQEWVLEIKAQCEEQKVRFFFKQWGGVKKHKTGRLLQGRTWDEMPKKGRSAKVKTINEKSHKSTKILDY